MFTRDETVKQTTVAMVAGDGFTRIYGSTALTLPNNGEMADIATYFPPAGGATVMVLTLPPDPKSPPPADFDMTPLIDEAQQKLAGLLDVMEPDGSIKTTSHSYSD